MSEGLTQTIPQNDSEKLTLILTTLLSTTVRVDSIDLRLQKVVDDVAQLREGQQQLHEGQLSLAEGQQRLELGQEVMRSEFETLKRSVNHRFLMLSGQVQASHNQLEERVTRIERNTNPPNSQT